MTIKDERTDEEKNQCAEREWRLVLVVKSDKTVEKTKQGFDQMFSDMQQHVKSLTNQITFSFGTKEGFCFLACYFDATEEDAGTIYASIQVTGMLLGNGDAKLHRNGAARKTAFPA